MARNIVLCCDGTSNQFSKDRTSVIKLFHALVKNEDTQLVYYHPGIGTRTPSGIGTKTGGRIGRFAGLVFGYRLQDDIADAYRFLMNHYQEGDRVYIFGFSRGAYTARVVSAMLHLYGLAMRGNDPLVPYAVEMLWTLARAKEGAPHSAAKQLARDFKHTISSRTCKTHFLGVWDTVNSVGWIGSPLTIPFGRDNPDVAIVRHAKALDERRGFFRVNWFKEDGRRDIQEVWFPGTHCDVGGGWPETESGMSKYPLAWMAAEAAKAGLLIDQSRLDEVLGRSSGPYMPRRARPPSCTMAWAFYGRWPSLSRRSIGASRNRIGSGAPTCSAADHSPPRRSCTTLPRTFPAMRYRKGPSGSPKRSRKIGSRSAHGSGLNVETAGYHLLVRAHRSTIRSPSATTQ